MSGGRVLGLPIGLRDCAAREGNVGGDGGVAEVGNEARESEIERLRFGGVAGIGLINARAFLVTDPGCFAGY